MSDCLIVLSVCFFRTVLSFLLTLTRGCDIFLMMGSGQLHLRFLKVSSCCGHKTLQYVSIKRKSNVFWTS